MAETWQRKSQRRLPWAKLQALVYDIVPSTTAIVDYAIGLGKLSANEQFFDEAQTVASFEQTIQIISGVSFTTGHVAYASTNETKIVWIETELLFFTRCGCVSCLSGCLGARLLPPWSYGFHSLSTQTFRRVLTASVDSYAEIKSAPLVA